MNGLPPVNEKTAGSTSSSFSMDLRRYPCHCGSVSSHIWATQASVNFPGDRMVAPPLTEQRDDHQVLPIKPVPARRSLTAQQTGPRRASRGRPQPGDLHHLGPRDARHLADYQSVALTKTLPLQVSGWTILYRTRYGGVVSREDDPGRIGSVLVDASVQVGSPDCWVWVASAAPTCSASSTATRSWFRDGLASLVAEVSR